MARIHFFCHQNDWCRTIAAIVEQLVVQFKNDEVLVSPSRPISLLSGRGTETDSISTSDPIIVVIGPSWLVERNAPRSAPNTDHVTVERDTVTAREKRPVVTCVLVKEVDFPFCKPLHGPLRALADVPQIQVSSDSLSAECISAIVTRIQKAQRVLTLVTQDVCNFEAIPHADGIAHWLVPVCYGLDTAIPLPVRDTLVIGRRPDCDICLDIASISRRHAQFSFTPDGCFLQDLWSRGRCYLNGYLCRYGEQHLLTNGDILSLADQEFVYREQRMPETH